MKKLACIILLAFSLPALAAGEALTERYKRQLVLIDSLRAFITNELRLDIPFDFYTRWQEGGDSMFVFLYASQPDKVAPWDAKQESWSFSSEARAQLRSDSLRRQGAHTLIYRTAGTSSANLTPKLLSYPDEAIAFIVFHEAVHNHVRNSRRGARILYEYEEALCDAVGIRACLSFCAKTKMLDMNAVLKQKDVLEETYAYINQQRQLIDAERLKPDNGSYKSSTEEVKRIACNANQFLKDRLCYEINNAFFLRNHSYATFYFEMTQLLHEKAVVYDAIDKAIKDHSDKTHILNKQGTLIELQPNENWSFPWQTK